MVRSSSRRSPVRTPLPKPNIRAVPFGPWPTRELTLTGPDREALRSIAVFQRLPPRTFLFRQGQAAAHIFNILGGCVYAERLLPTGARRGMALLLPGDLCGLASRGHYVNSVRSLTDTDLLKFPLEELKAVLLGNTSLQMIFLSKAAHGIRESQRQILLLSRKDPVERLALLISTLRHSPSGRPADSIPFPVTQHELASYLDLSPSQLSRALERLVREGVLRYSRGTLTVLDSRKLQRIVDQPPAAASSHDPPRSLDQPAAAGSTGGHRPIRLQR